MYEIKAAEVLKIVICTQWSVCIALFLVAAMVMWGRQTFSSSGVKTPDLRRGKTTHP